MQLEDKLAILADSAKYDVACTSSGVDRAGVHGKLGCSVAAGICHSFTPDGRCISLLKVLYSNACCYDCGYCVNRRSNDVPRATFTPRELAELTIGFYKRNYIEGLFLSSAVIGTPDYTMERMIEALRILRQEYHFNGYIHAKTIPGADAELVRRIGLLADRLSVNIELPSEASLSLLAPDKKKQAILKPMGQIAVQSAQSKKELVLYRHAPAFAPAGQSTQMIIERRRKATATLWDWRNLYIKNTRSSACSFRHIFRLTVIPACLRWMCARRFCGNTGCTRRTGFCGTMIFRLGNC